MFRFESVYIGLFVALFLGLFVATLSDYGITYDSANGELFLGDHYFYFLTSFDFDYLDLAQDKIAIYKDTAHPDFYATSEYSRRYSHHIWGFAHALTAASKHVFFTVLRVMDPVDAHHLALGLLVAIQLLVLYRFARHNLGTWAACASVLCLASYPRYWAHAHNNPKDIAEAVFTTLVIVCLFRAIRLRRPWGLATTGFLWGLALATKANAIFLPAILVPWLILELRRSDVPRLDQRTLACLALIPAIAFAVFITAWPLLLVDFPSNLVKHVEFLIERGGEGPAHWQIAPLRNALITMPLPVLVLAVVGLLTMWRRVRTKPEERSLHCLLALWLCVPIFRVSLPKAHDFDVIRHWLEFVPALALIVGIGVQQIIERLFEFIDASSGDSPPVETSSLGRKLVSVGLIWALFAPVIAWNVSNHPFQLVFYNSLVGGLAGAQARGDAEATDYWGSSYRAGLDWLNENAEPNPLLFVGVAEHIVRSVAEIWIRSDIEYDSMTRFSERLDEARTSGRDLYLMVITRRGHYDPALMDLEIRDAPVMELQVDGGAILRIFKLV